MDPDLIRWGLSPPPEVGEPLPEVITLDSDGNDFDLHADRKGQPAILVSLIGGVVTPLSYPAGRVGKGMPAFEAAGAKLYVLSYDEVDALADFKNAHGTTTMSQTLIVKLSANLHPQHHDCRGRSPLVRHSVPGCVTDSDGIILEKFFENNFTVRPGPEQLLAALKGEQVDLIKKNGDDQQVKVEVAFEGDTLPAGITRQIVARFSVPEGMHLYGQPVPEGLVPASIQLDEELEGIVSVHACWT